MLEEQIERENAEFGRWQAEHETSRRALQDKINADIEHAKQLIASTLEQMKRPVEGLADKAPPKADQEARSHFL